MKKYIGLSLLVFVSVSSLFSIYPSRFGRGYESGGFEMLYQFEQANRLLQKEEEKLDALQARRAEVMTKRGPKLSAAEQQRRVADFDAKIAAQQEVVEGIQKQARALATGRREMTPGMLVARGIAGDDFYMFDYGARVDSLWDGLKQGFILGTAKEFGDFVRTKMRGVFQKKLGALFDSTVNSVANGFERVREVLFHNSKHPFDENEVGAWQTHVRSVFDEIEKLTKDGLRDAYRSQDQTMRQAPVDLDDAVEGLADAGEKQVEPVVRIWADLFGGYVLQLSYYILVLQDRKGYYEVDSFEVFFATHLEERLKQFCNLLIKINDLADLDTYLAANKAVIPAYKSNVDNLFKQLQQQVKAPTFTTTNEGQSSFFDREKPSTRKNAYSGGYDADDYPQTGWAR